MSIRHRSSIVVSLLSSLVLLALLLSACGGAATGSGTASTPSAPLKDISIGLGYNPDVQFAPFYVAKSKGYYQAAGLNVNFNHGIVPDLVGSMIAGKNTFVFASGDELLVARDKNKDLKVIDVANVFQKYPVSLIVPADSPIKTLTDLKGRTIGEPGPFGATHTGLLALLYNAHLSLADVKVQAIGFAQVAALIGHKVDAVMGYSNNEPLQLDHNGFKVRTFAVSDYQPLVSNSIITTDQTLQGQSQTVHSFVQATLKGLRDVINDPAGAVQVTKGFVPGLNASQALQVLQATIPIYRGDGHLGYNDSATWSSMAQFLVAQKMIGPVANLSQVYTNQYIQ